MDSAPFQGGNAPQNFSELVALTASGSAGGVGASLPIMMMMIKTIIIIILIIIKIIMGPACLGPACEYW